MKQPIQLILLALGLLVLTSSFIDLTNPFNYSGQTFPNYITRNNTPTSNPITNKGATLGRVLFYDKKLSLNNTIACSSCHQQQFAFGDTAHLSKGFLGASTGRHSMRLSHAKFSQEVKFFWDERASSLEDQTTKPIQDFNEMGFSGTSGQPNLDSLISKLHTISYYKTLFQFVYGDTIINETRIQNSLAQFIRSIHSFDSKFDQGLAATGNLNANFPNYSTQENLGKTLFLAPPPAGGAGCQGCHRAPEFDIDPASLNNGVIAVAGSSTAIDLTNTKAPTLRDLFNSQGQLNGPFMHNGNFATIESVIEHYNLVPINASNTNLDPRVSGPGGNLQLTTTEKSALIAFLKTLSSNDIYTNVKWSNPFEVNGDLNLVTLIKEISVSNKPEFTIYPNPTKDFIHLKIKSGNFHYKIMDGLGRVFLEAYTSNSAIINLETLNNGNYYIELIDVDTQLKATKTFIKF